MISILENTKHLNMMKAIYNEEFKELLHPKKYIMILKEINKKMNG